MIDTNDHIGLIYHCMPSRDVVSDSDDWDDMFQELAVVMCRCAERFDDSLGNQFSTYACNSMKLYVHTVLRDRGKARRKFAPVSFATGMKAIQQGGAIMDPESRTESRVLDEDDEDLVEDFHWALSLLTAEERKLVIAYLGLGAGGYTSGENIGRFAGISKERGRLTIGVLLSRISEEIPSHPTVSEMRQGRNAAWHRNRAATPRSLVRSGATAQ